MRIIGGAYRGKQLTAPADLPVRPTTDFAKTGLFNILSTRYEFEKLKVLDLFAGTGSIAFEFFSRGCTDLKCIDRHAECIKYIRRTFEVLRAPSGIKVIQADVLMWLDKNNEKFDIIFADPPFTEDFSAELVEKIFTGEKINTGGLFILEHISGRDLSMQPFFSQTRKYGNVSFSFFSQ